MPITDDLELPIKPAPKYERIWDDVNRMWAYKRLPDPTPPPGDLHAAMEHLAKRYGKPGMQAIASLMHDMGSEAMIQFGDGTWWPCDFIMQAAWEHGGAPDDSLSSLMEKKS